MVLPVRNVTSAPASSRLPRRPRLSILTATAGLCLLLAACDPTPGDDDNGGSSSSTGDAVFDPALAEDLQDALDAIREDMGVSGLSAAILRPGYPTWTGTSGVSSTSDNRPLETNDLFKIASITKTYTAALNHLLIEDGALSLDTPLSDHVDAHSRGAEITIRNLLNHSSGLGEFTELSAFREDATGAWETEDLVDLIRAEPLEFDPGADCGYSNTNYLMLALVAEAVTGLDWHDAIAERVLTPASLENTVAPDPTAALPEYAAAHWGGTVLSSSQQVHHSAMIGAGSILATASDVAHWGDVLFRGPLLSEATRETYWIDALPYHGSSMGLGAVELYVNGTIERGHDGALAGFASWMGHRPDSGITLALLGNDWPLVGGDPDYTYPLANAPTLWEVLEAGL